MVAQLNRKAIFSFLILSLLTLHGFSQNKPIIDIHSIENWGELGSTSYISKTGKYVVFSLVSGKKANVILKNLTTGHQKEFKKTVDRLRFIGDEYLAFYRKDSLFVANLPQLEEKFIGISNGYFSQFVDNSLDLVFREKSKGDTYQTVHLNLKSGRRKIITEAKKESIVPILKTDVDGINSIWMSDKGGNLQRLVDDRKLQVNKGLKIRSVDGISESGTIRLTLTSVPVVEKKGVNSYLGPVLWSYKDNYIQSGQEKLPIVNAVNYAALFVQNSKEIIQLADSDHMCLKSGQNSWMIKKRNANFVYGVNQPNKCDYLVSEIDGSRISLDGLDPSVELPEFVTKDNRLIVYFDEFRGDFYSYDVKKKITTNLTGKTVSFRKVQTDEFSLALRPWAKYMGPPAGTLLDDETFIANDGFDFWRIDPFGKNAPICLSAHFGRDNNIVLEPIHNLSFSGDLSRDPVVLVGGFNPKTKKRGLFEMSIANSGIPKQIAFEDASFLWHTFSNGRRIPIKASGANKWLFQMCTASKSPNLYISDGSSIKQVTDFRPENNYNWLTSELLSWKTKRGEAVQGILYKPENIDIKKKYPVIINYYEEKSEDVHLFHKPELMHSGNIDIPTMVSRGYLVFVPDMKNRVGDVLENALECLESGTDEISKRPYVDQNRIGLNGHSHGGYETAYFVTHSARYKAALIGAPITNTISWYNDWTPIPRIQSLGNPQNNVEKKQTRMVSSLWERPEWYIQNSAVFCADKVQTPILLMHNRADSAVPFSQGAEFFLSLSRLGKPAWMLDYEKEGHLVGNIDNKKDLTIRAQQFFDHYLKNAPAPLWMLEGIAYKDRGYKTGLELDTLGRKPGKSPLITGAEQKLIDEYSKVPLSEKLKKLKD